ncbi:MAG: hypothetical protein HYS27_13625 [Deltaproteobacteria bacterium]|nr:hypothetical protein [Deltaproteobacteria bacterium]
MHRRSHRLAVAAALAVAAFAGAPAKAAVDLTEEEFRLYCGYLDAIEQPAVAKLSGKKRDQKVASMAKVKLPVLLAAVEKGGRAGATCDEIGKKVERDAKSAVEGALPGRVVVFNFDDSDPSHVVAQVTWLGIDKKKVLEEASLLAVTLASEAKITKTIAIRAVDPGATDKLTDEAMWWEGKITRPNAARIDKAKIPDYALTRYVRLFDGCKTNVGADYCTTK